jgi:Ca2+-binding EF-hand superfamily protein
MKEDPRLRELPGHGRGTRTETIPSAPILVMRKAKRLAFQVRHQEYRIVSSKYVLCSILENTRGELLLEAHDPKTAQRHTLQLAREQCRVLLRTKLDLLCNRGQSLWEHMCSLMVLRPDPEAGRAATLRLNLAKLEVVAEEAALKCVETKRKINKVEDAKSDALVERRRLKDLSLAARDLAEGDGGAMKPITLLRMLEFNMQRAKKEFLRSCTVVRRLKELYSRLSDSLFEETLERQKRIRASAAMRRLLVEQRSKDGLLLALSDARPDEHWKRVWVGTRAFGGTLLDLEKDEHAAAASSSTTKSPHPPLVAKAEVNADLPYDPERYLLRGANYVVLEVLTRPRGTKTDTSDVWIRARFETRWEQEQRTMREEMLLMDYEERRTRRVMKVTAEMKLRLEAQRIAKRKAAREKRIEDRKLRAMLRLENEAKKRLQRLAALARTLGETVGLRWDEKIAKPRTRPPSAAGGAPPAPEAASALPPPGLMEGVIGQPLEWDKLSETFPLGNGATRTVIGTGMDPRELKQIAEGGTKRRNKDKGSSAAGGGDAPQDETLIPRLKARASKWGLANGPKGCAMYPCVFEMLRYRVGGQMKKRNKRMKAMFVPADEVIPPEKEAMALLTLAQAEYDPIKAKYDEYYTLANDEEANYEDKTKAEAKLLPVSKALEKVKADLDLAQAAYDEAQATADAIAKANSKDANKSEYYESDEEDDPEAPGYVPPPHVPKMFGIDIAPPGTHRFDREWFDNPRTATMYPCVAQMLGLNDDGYLLEHPANALNDEDFYASMAEEDSQLDIRHEEQGTTNGNILIIQGDAVDAPAFAEGALDLRRLTRKNVDRLGGNSQRESRPPSAVSMRSSSRFSARSSRPSTANSKSGSRQKKKKRRSDNDISVWLPEGMHAWTEKDLEANDSKFIRERAVALRKAESDAKSDPNPTAEAKARALRESNKIIDTTLAPSVAPPPVEVALALRIRGAFNAARGVPARSRKWRRKRRRIPKSFKDRDTGEEVKQNEMPSFRFSHSNPLSLTDQHNMEADARAMGKVWFRCIRKVPVGMNKREQIKFARDPTSVKQEYRRVIVTVQSAPMPASQSRRLNSAIDISSVMRVEMYDPSTSKAHVAVIDADDVAGQRWSKHVKANRSVQILVGHLRMHYDYASTGGERTTMSAAKATSKENSRPGLRGPMIGFGPLVECYDWKVTTHPRSARYCRRSSLLPWACGTGSELYTTKAWQNGPAVPPQYAADRPKPLFRGTRLIKDFTGKPYRVLVSAWREMSTGGKNSGGCRIDVYYPPTSQCWTIQVGPQELEIMTDKMEAAARAVAKIETEKKGDGKMKGKKKKKKKVDESVVVSRGPLTPEEVKLQLLIAHENSRLETLVDWAPERKRILAERAKRKKKAVEAALRAKENDEESKKLDPTPPGRRELAWLTKVLAIDRHPATGVVQPPKKMKGRRKLWQQRKKLDAKNGKGKQKPNKHAQVQIAKGIAAVMAAAVVNRAGRSFAEVPSASTMKQSVDKAMAKLLPVPPKNGAADANTADMDGPEQGKDGQVINGKKRNKEKMGKRKKGKGKKKKKKQTEGSDTEETGSDDIAGEEDMDEDMFRQMFVEEVTSERLRIRPNTAYDDGTKTSKSRLRKKGGASSSLDLVEAEGVASMSEFSRSSKLFQAPDEGADDLPQHFSGLFIPRNARAPMRIIYFKLSSWQQQVHSVLEQGTRSHQEYYEGMDELEAMDDASLEHRSVKTGAGNARKVFDKNKNAKVNLTTADKQKIEEEEGRMFTNVAEKKSTPENNWHIQRMTVNAGEGAVFNRIMRPAPLCASDTKEQNGYSGAGSEAAATEQDKAAAQDSVDDIQQDAEAAPPREKPINLRASVLCATDIEGDAVWMRRDGDEEIAGMLQADRNAILRFLNEEKARKKEEEERARKQRLLEQQQSTRSKLRRRSSAARSPPTSSSPGAGEGSLSSSTLSVQEVGGDTLPSSLHSQPMLDDSLKNVLNISVEEGAADQARQLEAESKKSETLEESKYQGKQEPNGESSDDHPGSSDDEATADITGDDFSTASSIGKNSLLIPRWKKALNERRGLKRSCKPPKVDERLAEATHAKGVVHAHKLVDTEVIASDEILQRRLYRRSPIDAGVPIAPPGLQGERNDVAKANHRVVLSLKLHRYEISALAAASRQGNANICKGDQPLGHRPAYDVEALRGWIRTRLTLRKIPLKGALQKTSSRSRKPFRQKPEDMAVTHRWKLSVDRTIVKEVRRLPPHSTLMILHAVRVAGLLKDKDESYGVSSGGGNAGSSSAGGKKKKKRALGHQARNGRNASLMIVGHNPMTGEQMTMVPDIYVLETATGSDKDPSLSYLFKGGSRHENMRRAAEKVIDQLVVMKRNGRPTLSHIRMRWVQEALRRAAEAAALEKAFQMEERRARSLRIALQALCQRTRMRRYRMGVLARRAGLHLREIPEPTHEWGPMLREDLSAHEFRRFLTADKKEFIAIRAAFDMFDADQSGSIDAREFQSLCFEIGEVLNKRQVAAAVQAIDRDGSGAIEFDEFAMWWVTSDHGSGESGSLSASKMARLKAALARRRWRRQAKEKLYIKMRSARLAGKHYSQRRQAAREAKREKMAKVRARRERLAAMRRGEFGFAAAAAQAAGPSAFDAQAGDVGRLARREKPWDGIPGGAVGRVIFSPYWATRWEIKKRMRARQLQKERKEVSLSWTCCWRCCYVVFWRGAHLFFLFCPCIYTPRIQTTPTSVFFFPPRLPKKSSESESAPSRRRLRKSCARSSRKRSAWPKKRRPKKKRSSKRHAGSRRKPRGRPVKSCLRKSASRRKLKRKSARRTKQRGGKKRPKRHSKNGGRRRKRSVSRDWSLTIRRSMTASWQKRQRRNAWPRKKRSAKSRRSSRRSEMRLRKRWRSKWPSSGKRPRRTLRTRRRRRRRRSKRSARSARRGCDVVRAVAAALEANAVPAKEVQVAVAPGVRREAEGSLRRSGGILEISHFGHLVSSPGEVRARYGSTTVSVGTVPCHATVSRRWMFFTAANPGTYEYARHQTYTYIKH